MGMDMGISMAIYILGLSKTEKVCGHMCGLSHGRKYVYGHENGDIGVRI